MARPQRTSRLCADPQPPTVTQDQLVSLFASVLLRVARPGAGVTLSCRPTYMHYMFATMHSRCTCKTRNGENAYQGPVRVGEGCMMALGTWAWLCLCLPLGLALWLWLWVCVWLWVAIRHYRVTYNTEHGKNRKSKTLSASREPSKS
jgi:hypothetical protein